MGYDRTRDPQRDKALSYQKDCRNSYGESPHAARKAIPRNKQRAHRKVRTNVKQDLHLFDTLSPEQQDQVESNARNDVHRVGTWKKQSDSPLGRMVAVASTIREREDGKIDRDECSERLDALYEKFKYR